MGRKDLLYLHQQLLQRKRKKPWISAAAAFLIPIAIMLIAYGLLGVYPFGDKSLLLVDMHNEYIDYYAHFHRVIRGEGSLLRSWSMGMGLNSMGLFAFYTASPLHILLFLSPIQYLTEAVLAVTLLKFGLCGLSFYGYARYSFGGERTRILHLAASVAYALCGYNLAYSSNLMWLDGVFMLPLICMGTERLLRDGKGGLLTAGFLYLFLSGYYIGYMVGLYSFLYFTVSCIARKYSLKECSCRFLRFLLAAVTAAGCCAFLLLPAFLELRHGQAELWNVPLLWQLDIPLSGMGAKLLPGAYDSLTNRGLPNLYCSVAAVVGAALFFTGKQAGRREKLAWGGLLLLLVLSLSCNVMDLGWHAFEDPTWFPARYSFVIAFTLLQLAVRGLGSSAEISIGAAVAAAGIPMLLFVEAGIQRYRFAPARLVLWGVLLAAAYGCMACLLVRGGIGYPWKPRRSQSHRALALLLLLLVCAETTANAVLMVRGMDDEFQYRSRSRYHEFRENWGQGVDWVAEHSSQPARMEILQQRNANGGLTFGYNGISHYSTTTDQGLNTWLKALGYNTGTINELRFARSNPLTNGLLGIQYVLSTEEMGEGYRLVHQAGDVGVYQNQLAFPMAFFAEKSAIVPDGTITDPFLYQNQLINALNGEEAACFIPVDITEIRAENMVAGDQENAIRYSRINPAQDGGLEIAIYNPTGYPAYAFLPVANRRFAKATAYVDGVEIQRELAYRGNSLIPLGGGETAVLRLEVTSGDIQVKDIYCYALDLEAAAGLAEPARSNAMTVSQFQDTYVEGAVTAPKNGALVTTFPHDPGWRVYVDGRQAPLQKFAGVFLAVELEAGNHTIVMRYSPPGFAAGIVITTGTILLWIGCCWLKGRGVQNGRNMKINSIDR